MLAKNFSENLMSINHMKDYWWVICKFIFITEEKIKAPNLLKVGKC